MLNYKVRKFKNNKTQKTVYYPAVTNTRRLNFKDLMAKIVRETHLTQPDITAAVTALVDVLKANLREGRRVRFGSLGTFFLTIRSLKGQIEKDKVSAKDISHLRVRFLPSTNVKGGLKLDGVSVQKLAWR